jgi:cell wall-associated NlpC family hydrolase
VGCLRVNRPLQMLLACAVASLVLVVMPGTEARADPTVTEVEAQIQRVWGDAEPLIEEYNGVHEQYRKNKAKQDELGKKVEPLQRQFELGQLRVGVISAEVYKGGQASAFNALVTSGSPRTFAEQLSFLDQLAREQGRQLQGVTTMKQEYDAQKAPIDKLVADLAAQDADLAKKKKSIDAQIAELQRLRIKAYGGTASAGSFRPWPCPSAYEPTNGYKAAKFACSQAGKPYVWAAAGPGSYDCSGLTLAAWQSVGVSLPHQSKSQRSSMPHVTRANLKVGDLVFYYGDIHHVAIYVGNNKIMHAPSAGDNVRMADMDAAGPINSFGRPS